MSCIPQEADRVIILANPKAGRGSQGMAIERLDVALRERGFFVEILSDPDRLADEAARTQEAGQLRTVVAAGGDGTARLVANRTSPEVAITMLPLGTENLLAKTLQLSTDPQTVFQAICGGRTVRLDAGRVGDRLFLLMLGCGFDAEVVQRLHQRRSGNIHHLSYARPILESILCYRYPEIRVSYRDTETGAWTDQDDPAVHWAFVFNLPSYAAGLPIAPQADGTDGRLDVCTFRGGSVWRGLMHLCAVMLGRHQQGGRCVSALAKSIRIESDEPVRYQMDGDPGGFLPVEIEVLPQRVRLVAPPENAQLAEA